MSSGRHQHAVPRRRSGQSRLRAALAGLIAVGLAVLGSSFSSAPLLGQADAAVATVASSAVSTQVVATRVHLVGGADVPADSRTVRVTVDVTKALKDRQPVNVSWTGAHPTGGIVNDTTSSLAAEQEYPVVIMECRGVDSASAPVAQQMRPETCWTQTPSERYISANDDFPAFRLDRYATPANRTRKAGLPSTLPSDCVGLSSGTEHWLSFVATDGKSYLGGPNGCGGVAPEAVAVDGSSQVGNTTYGHTDASGAGNAKFILQSSDTNASLGCSSTTPCSLVVIPIMGISCDAVGAGLPPADQPPAAFRTLYQKGCAATGNLPADGVTPVSQDTEEIAVSGRLWWSESNWRNRVSIPLSFAPPANVCSIVSSAQPSLIYGSQLMTQVTLQWAPKFCTDPKLFNFKHVQTSEPQAKNLLDVGSVEAAFQAGPPSLGFTKPIVQAPVALTAFTVAFAVDGADGKPLPSLKLTPRLLAKLLTQSYASNPTISGENPAVKGNPLDIGRDPEFKALNPSPITDSYFTEAAATLFTVSSDSDVVHALTSYVNADPEARAFLDGTPDPWGMHVNTNYKGIALPVEGWPQLDSFVSPYFSKANLCMAGNAVPFLPLVAGPVSDPNTVTFNMQYGIANSQVFCKNAGASNQKLVALGRETPGQRLILGVVGLGDAERYQLPTAELLTHVDASAADKFTDATGRTFVAPTAASVRAAAALLKPSKDLGTWPVDYASLRTSAAGAAAYPGIMLLSLDVPTKGLSRPAAQRYSQLITFASGAGQVPGVGNGELPAGYLPMTAANGVGALVTYAQDAAAAVLAQQGYVPAADGSSKPPTPTPSPTPTPTPTPSNVPSTGTPSGTGGQSGGGSQQPTPSPSTAASSPAPSPSASPVQIVAVGKTSSVAFGALSGTIPALLLFALLTGGTALVLGLWRRA